MPFTAAQLAALFEGAAPADGECVVITVQPCTSPITCTSCGAVLVHRVLDSTRMELRCRRHGCPLRGVVVRTLVVQGS